MGFLKAGCCKKDLSFKSDQLGASYLSLLKKEETSKLKFPNEPVAKDLSFQLGAVGWQSSRRFGLTGGDGGGGR